MRDNNARGEAQYLKIRLERAVLNQVEHGPNTFKRYMDWFETLNTALSEAIRLGDMEVVEYCNDRLKDFIQAQKDFEGMNHQDKINNAKCCDKARVEYLYAAYEPRHCWVICEEHNTKIYIEDTTDYKAMEDQGIKF